MKAYGCQFDKSFFLKRQHEQNHPAKLGKTLLKRFDLTFLPYGIILFGIIPNGKI
jgi:hypothetical protein